MEGLKHGCAFPGVLDLSLCFVNPWGIRERNILSILRVEVSWGGIVLG